MLKIITVVASLTIPILSFAVEQSNTTYAINGGSNYFVLPPAQPEFTPTKVWDDGEFTYIELAKNYTGQIPVVFKMSDQKSPELINFRLEDQRTLKISGVVPHIKLAWDNKFVLIDQQK